MQITFRTQVTSIIFGLILTSVGGTTVFFIQLYKKDKMSEIFRAEQSNIQRAVDHLNNLINLADVIELDKAKSSKSIIMIFEDPCKEGVPPHGVVADEYDNRFKEMEIQPRVWMDSISFFRACNRLKSLEVKAGALSALIVPTKIQIMEPYLPVLLRGIKGIRFALLSMDGFQASVTNTLFILDSLGNRIWSSDGDDYVDAAMRDTGIDKELLFQFKDQALKSGSSDVLRAGEAGVVSFQSALGEWVIFSLSYEPAVLQSVYFALYQAICLALAFIVLCLFIGRNLALIITKPLNELRAHAERLGNGEFEQRIEIGGSYEIGILKAAFNTMTEQILKLIGETKDKANLERELELAQEIQEMLLPAPEVTLKNHRISSYVQAAAQCGGDWWGYLEVPSPQGQPILVLMVGDVTGHGTSSALITAAIRGGLSVLAAWIEENKDMAGDPRLVNQVFNRAVYEAAKSVINMTLFTVVMDPNARLLYCSNAGHNLPYLIVPKENNPKEFTIKAIGQAGIPLGQSPDTLFTELDTHPWKEGDKLLLFTDGIMDCFDGDTCLYSKKAFRKAIDKNSGQDTSGMIQNILTDHAQKTKGHAAADDITLVVCGFQGAKR